MSVSPETLAALSDGARLAGALPYVRAELEALERAVENRVYSALERGELSAEAANAAWIEKASLRRLLKRLEAKVRMGTAAGEAAAEELDRR